MTALRRPLAAVLMTGAGALVPAGGAVAQITTIPTLSATVGGAYSTNPFLAINGEDAASVQTDIRPQLQLIDGTDQAVISGTYNRADYLSSRYGSNSGYGVQASGSKRFNERASVSVFAGFDSQVLGANNGFITPANPILTPPVITAPGTGTGPTPAIPSLGSPPVANVPIANVPIANIPIDGDVGLIGFRQRRNMLTAGLSGSYTVSPRSTWNAGVNAMRSSYPNNRGASLGFAADFTSYSGNLGYSRTLTERSSVGFQLTATHAKYDNGFDSQIYTPQLTYNRSLSERWTLAVGAGAGFTRDFGRTRVNPSINASACRSGERSNGCLSVASAPVPSGFGGVRLQTSVGVNYNRRFDENLSASVSGNYSHIGSGEVDSIAGLPVDSQNLYQGDLTVQRRLGRRLSGVASVSYRNAGGLGQDIPGDVTGRLGVSILLGAR